ncbi:MAG: ABC transporter permease subunit [Xanthomonadaceae bacterium]|nr:ABC transporter permease subunit [Silanimonas sp.]MBS3924307.1 ABC transporter permease subunit [Xanthomonadaceae bacterium]
MPSGGHAGWWDLWYQVFLGLFRQIGALGRELRGSRGRYLVIAVPMLWLLAFFLAPLLVVLQISLAQRTGGVPPYSELVAIGEQGLVQITLSLAGYLRLLSDPLYVESYLSSLQFASVSTLACLLIGYPIAYGIARARPLLRLLLLVGVLMPFLTSSLLRTYALSGLLRDSGLVNQVLIALGVIDSPVRMLDTPFAVYVGITYNYLPFMVLPLVANLMRLDNSLLQAAADLGARPWRAFLSVTLPLSLPGIVAGSLLVFIPAVGEYVIPALLGGPGSLTIGQRIWEDFFNARNYPLAAAVAMAMLALIVVPMLIFERFQEQRADHEEQRR